MKLTSHQTKKNCALVVLSTLLMSCALVAPRASAQNAKQQVPDNVAPHPAPAQPLPYSHKTHLALGLMCKNCHTNPDPGIAMGFPPTARCMQCHVEVAKEKPAIQKLTAFAKSGQAIPWVRVYQLTPGVNWSHRKHLQAGMECQMCHGDVSQLDAIAQVTAVTSMASCISCHQAHSAPTVCQTCHSWPSN